VVDHHPAFHKVGGVGVGWVGVNDAPSANTMALIHMNHAMEKEQHTPLFKELADH
jgi:hypothetical protein